MPAWAGLSSARGGRVVAEDSTVFVGVDAAKAKHAVFMNRWAQALAG